MNIKEMSLKLHEDRVGKIEVISKMRVENKEDLSLAYTPGVAEPCKKIHENKEDVYKYTAKSNLVAVVTDGSAVLGLGDIGPEAAMPVMEGKAILFKEFANIDAFPICLNTKNTDEIVNIVKAISPTFGGINLEDIGAPRCFEIEEKLKKELDIPVFHDDQHGTAVVTIAGLINALKIVNKKFEDIFVVINGAGAAGAAITKMLNTIGVKDILLCDRQGIIYSGSHNNEYKEAMANITNKYKRQGSLKDALVGADVFIGVSAPDIVTKEMVKSMNVDPIIFALANPTPEIMPNVAKEAGAKVIATGRSDFHNQINNVLAFPGIFRGALNARAKEINEEMKLAAAYAIGNLVNDDELTPEYIIPNPFDKRVIEGVAKAVEETARKTGVARI